jgi:polar amino acid transport system permease protein
MARDPDRIIPLRHYGRWLSGGLVVILVALVVKAFAQGQIDWPVVRSFFTAPALVKGLGHTLLITFLSMALGLVLGLLFAVMRLSKNPVTRSVATAYVWLFRGTPVYLQLLIWFNLALIFPNVSLGFFHARMVDVMTPFLAALLGLGVNEGSYMTEIVRGGILSVEQGQLDAASSLGMSRLLAMRRVVIPQAMRVIVPSFGNEFIGMLKTSAMASAIAYTEMLNQAQIIYFINDKIMELLLVAAGWYLIVVTLFSGVQYYIERQFARGQSHELPPSLLERLWSNLFAGHRAAAAEERR